MSIKKQTLLALLSMTGFILLWAILTDAWNYSALIFSEHMLAAGKYLYGYFSRVVWMLPAFILIFKFDKSLFWGKKALFSRPKAEPVTMAFMACVTVYAFASMAVNYHSLHITDENLLLLTVKLLFVAVGEETVFRGLGYNLLKKVGSGAAPLIISAVMFVLLHWPAYFVRLFLYGGFSLAGFAAQSISAFICGLLFAVMLKKSGTLLNPMIAHFYYDFMLEVFA